MADNAGPLFLRAGLITQAQLHDAYLARGRGGGTLGEWLVAIGALDEERLCAFYRERLLVPRVGREELGRVEPHVISRIPPDMAAEFRAVPVAVEPDHSLILAMADPSDTHAVDEIGFFTGANVYRVVAPPTAIAWALATYYGIELPHLMQAPPAAVRPKGSNKRQAVIVEDVFNEDTPIPQPVPLADTGSIQRITPAPLLPVPPPETSPESEAALEQALLALAAVGDRDAVALALVEYLHRICGRAAFFVVRKGQLGGWLGVGLSVKTSAVRDATLPLDGPSTFRDVIQARLPFRGPVTDPASRDFLIDALGWAPSDMLAVPISVRDKVVGILYGDERTLPLPDEHLQQISRAAEAALARALQARR